jgi:predicted nucleotidyltransferase
VTWWRPEPVSSVSRLLDAVIDWVSAQPDACGLALVGSHARHAARPDSDIDLVILTLRVSDYVAATDWAMRFGDVDHLGVEPHGA